MQGKKVKSGVLLAVGTAEPLRLLAQEMGLVDGDKGVVVITKQVT